MNFESVKLKKGKIIDDAGKDRGTLLDFLKNQQVILEMKMALTEYIDVHKTPELKSKLKGVLEKEAVSSFTKLFKEKKGELSVTELDKAISDLVKIYTKYGEELHTEILQSIKSKLNKSKIGGDMFKTLKEAKEFTTHLDALASEIQTLEEISPDMRTHLAFRLDRLSDLIEVSADKDEKKASLEKEANGVGSGAWAYDEDEARYMSSFGGTGALKRDADEPYMDEFLGDDHKEVLERKEPMAIKDDGAKVPQPSDNYKEAPIAQKLRGIVKEVMKQMKE